MARHKARLERLEAAQKDAAKVRYIVTFAGDGDEPDGANVIRLTWGDDDDQEAEGAHDGRQSPQA